MKPASALFCLLCLAALPARAQETPAAPPPRPAFPTVIPHPTGQNGYEELVMAGDLLRTSRLFAQAEKGNATLAQKRAVLLDRPVVKALALLKQGLAKPIASPRDTLSSQTLLPELSEFRSLARLLRLQQYVLLADGRTTDAIQTARTVLRLGRVVQTDTLISGLVGVAISSLGIQSMGDHLDQLSARDCDLLFRVCLEWLSRPPLNGAMLAAERRSNRIFAGEVIAAVKSSEPKKQLMLILGPDAENLERANTLFAGRTPEQLDRMGAELLQKMDGQLERVLLELQKPSWARDWSPLKTGDDSSPVGWLASQLIPPVEQVDQRYTAEQAKVRLLAVHCAIRRYRWEAEELPPSLAVLNLGELAVDPFTGEPLKYTPRGTRYTLGSAGPPTDPTNERAVGGRLPITLGN